MFSNEFTGLPRELILKILNELSLRDAVAFLTVSKEMQGIIKNDSVWRKFGAENFTAFATRLSALPYFLQRSVIYGKYDFETCERVTQAIYGESDLSPVQALTLLLPPEYSQHFFGNPYPIFRILMPEYKYCIYKGVDEESMNDKSQRSTAIGFLEKLISPEQMAKLKEFAIMDLFRQNGIKALKNKLITPEEAAAIDTNKLHGKPLITPHS